MAGWGLWVTVAIAAGWLAVAGIAVIGLHFTRDLPRLRLSLALLMIAALLLVLASTGPTAGLIAVMVDPSAVELGAVAMIVAAFAFLPRHWRQSRDAMRGLAEAEASYRSLFEHSADGLYQTTPEGRILRANMAFARLLGFESVAALMNAGLNVASGLYLAEHRRREFIGAVTANCKVEGFDSQILCRDGTVIWVSESARAVRDHQG